MKDTPFRRFTQDVRRWIAPGEIRDDMPLSLGLVLRLCYKHMPLRAMAWYRLASWCRINRVPFFPGHIQRRILRHYGLEIQVGADIGGGLYIPHPVGTVIAAEKIGRNCSIIAAVTIGMRNEWTFPVIGDGVFIGAGARILGGITVGNGAVIGANAVVIHDVPAGATAIGIPARIKQDHRALGHARAELEVIGDVEPVPAYLEE